MHTAACEDAEGQDYGGFSSQKVTNSKPSSNNLWPKKDKMCKVGRYKSSAHKRSSMHRSKIESNI